MSHSSGHLDQLTPNPMECPLISLGTANSSRDDAYLFESYNYHNQYNKTYDDDDDDDGRTFHNKQMSLDTCDYQNRSHDNNYVVSTDL